MEIRSTDILNLFLILGKSIQSFAIKYNISYSFFPLFFLDALFIVEKVSFYSLLTENFYNEQLLDLVNFFWGGRSHCDGHAFFCHLSY